MTWLESVKPLRWSYRRKTWGTWKGKKSRKAKFASACQNKEYQEKIDRKNKTNQKGVMALAILTSISPPFLNCVGRPLYPNEPRS